MSNSYRIMLRSHPSEPLNKTLPVDFTCRIKATFVQHQHPASHVLLFHPVLRSCSFLIYAYTCWAALSQTNPRYGKYPDERCREKEKMYKKLFLSQLGFYCCWSCSAVEVFLHLHLRRVRRTSSIRGS